MGAIFAIIMIILVIFSLFSILTFYSTVLFNGSPSDYYSPARMLTQEELALLKQQFPKESFRPELYQIAGQLTQRSTSIRTGGNVGFYDYYQLNELKVHISYMGTKELAEANSASGHYQVVKGKRKNYLVDVNGYNFFVENRKNNAWLDCWNKAINGQPTEARRLRILGQRQVNKQEVTSLKKMHQEVYKVNSYAIGMLLFLPLLFLLMALNFTDSYSAWLLWPIIGFVIGISYCFWLHPRFFPVYIDKINIIEGSLRWQANSQTLFVGDLACNVSSPEMCNQLNSLPLNGKIKAIEVSPLGYWYEVINIEGIGHINRYWQRRIPTARYMHYLVSAIACLIFVSALYGLRLQNYPYQDIWPWTEPSFRSEYTIHNPQGLDALTDLPRIVQLQGEFEPYLDKKRNNPPILYWNSDSAPLLPPLSPPTDLDTVQGNILFVTEFKWLQQLQYKGKTLVKTQRYNQLTQPYADYYQKLLTQQANEGAAIRLYGDTVVLPTYQLGKDAVTILNHISQRDNRKTMTISGRLTRHANQFNDEERKTFYVLEMHKSEFNMYKINAFNGFLLLIYLLPALGFSLWCIGRNRYLSKL